MRNTANWTEDSWWSDAETIRRAQLAAAAWEREQERERLEMGFWRWADERAEEKSAAFWERLASFEGAAAPIPPIEPPGWAVWLLANRRGKFTGPQAEAIQLYYVENLGRIRAAKRAGCSEEAFRKRLRGAQRVARTVLIAEAEGRPPSTVRRVRAGGRRPRATGSTIPERRPLPPLRPIGPCVCGHRDTQHFADEDDGRMECEAADCLCNFFQESSDAANQANPR